MAPDGSALAAVEAPTQVSRPSQPPQARPQHAMLDGPIVRTLFRLAWPSVTVLVIQTFVGLMETYFVGFLGTDALAGVSLVFPLLMLMTTMSNGGIGGGVSAAIARALGAGRHDDANALVLHAVVLAVAFGAVFSFALIVGGPVLYSTLGGREGALTAALTYSNLIFAGAIPTWIVALLASALRGSGNVRVPAAVTFIGAVILVPLSAALIFGWGPVPRLEVAGAGIAVFTYFASAAVFLLAYLVRGSAAIRLRRAKLEWRLFKAILGVGALSAVGTVQTNLTVALVTAAVGLLGTEAIAGYGVASRLDYILIPLLFGIGSAVLTMAATNLGAGQAERARRVAWIGAFIGAGIAEAIGIAAALAPEAWIGVFSTDPATLATGSLYLRIVGPFYGLFGFGLMLYFASQGAGRVFWPVMSGSVRLVVAGVGGWAMAALFNAPLAAVFIAVALATFLYGAMSGITVYWTPWRRKVA